MDLNEANYELGLFLASPPSHAAKLSCLVQSSSTTDTTSHREVKGARRVRNACLQCRERKIRCSRTYPCKGCISRGDGAACDWQGGFPTGNIPNYQKHVADQRRQFEELQERITCAKACLNAVVQQDSNLNLKFSQHQTGTSFLPSSLLEQEPLWFSRGPHLQPPDSAASNLSSFSTNTVESSQHWFNEEFTEYSPSSVNLDTKNFVRGVHPADLFGMKHKHSRYRSLSLLFEGDGQPFDSSRPYFVRPDEFTASSQLLDQAPSTRKISVHTNNSKPHFGFEMRSGRISGSIGASSSRRHENLLTTEAASRSTRGQKHTIDGMEAAHPFTTTEIDWPSSLPSLFNKSPSFFENHPRRRSSQSCHLEPNSPLTPHRHVQNFNVLQGSIGAHENVATSLIGNLCHHYLPEHPHLTGQDIVPITEPNPSEFRNIPWSAALPRNLEQAVQADVAMGLMLGGQYCGLMAPGLSLAPIIDTTQMAMCNQNLNWDAFSS